MEVDLEEVPEASGPQNFGRDGGCTSEHPRSLGRSSVPDQTDFSSKTVSTKAGIAREAPSEAAPTRFWQGKPRSPYTDQWPIVLWLQANLAEFHLKLRRYALHAPHSPTLRHPPWHRQKNCEPRSRPPGDGWKQRGPGARSSLPRPARRQNGTGCADSWRR